MTAQRPAARANVKLSLLVKPHLGENLINHESTCPAAPLRSLLDSAAEQMNETESCRVVLSSKRSASSIRLPHPPSGFCVLRVLVCMEKFTLPKLPKGLVQEEQQIPPQGHGATTR